MAERINTEKLLGIVIGMLLIGILLPIGLKGLLDPSNWMYNSTTSLWDVIANGSTIQTLVLTLLPILIIVGLIMYFVPRPKPKP
ncbi:MAG: hypothetical protein ACTSO2_13745 [Promethearchaeota archaeon]